jgi:hypothetical protein
MLGGGAKNCPKKYNIDYFGYAAQEFMEKRESRIHGNSIKSAYVLKKNISITP